MEKQYTVITGTEGYGDIHTIGSRILSKTLKDAGFKVVWLGVSVAPDSFIKAAQETNADAILMSSLYGMAELDLQDFKKKCIEAGLENVLLYIGGHLSIGRHDFKDDEKTFTKLGFDRVFPPDVDLVSAIKDLRSDLKKKSKV